MIEGNCLDTFALRLEAWDIEIIGKEENEKLCQNEIPQCRIDGESKR